MKEPRTPATADSVKRVQRRRRVKRGLVASYIHEISERHNPRGPRSKGLVEAAPGG
jgi:hypothetical protein